MTTIGVFDSGVGGLTVLKELALHFKNTHFIYLGDTARLPYGTKSPETIRAYSEQILNFLWAKKVDALVIACNTASSQVQEKTWKSVPVFNVIEPGARLAVASSRENRIGVLGTRALIGSHAYTQAIQKLSSKVEVFTQACPLFVPLAEEGWTDDPITNLIAYRYLQPLIAAKIDTLILGCTHYPLLKSAIQKVCGHSVQLIDSGKAIAEEIEIYFNQHGINFSQSPPGKVDLLVTDISTHTRDLAQQILQPIIIDSFEVAQL